MQCQLIEEYNQKNGPIHWNAVEDVLVDFVLRCVKGPYVDNFIFINLVPEGEIIGRDPAEGLTLCIDDPNLAPKHCQIFFNPVDKKYVLQDLGSEFSSWSLLRREFPVLIFHNMHFKIDENVFVITFDHDSEFNEVQQWLERIELDKLKQVFQQAGFTAIQDLHTISQEYINSLDMNEVERMNLEQGLKELPEDFKNNYQAFKVIISSVSQDDEEARRLLEVGWSGAVIGTMQDADLLLSQEADNSKGYDQGKKHIEFCVKYEYGQYWLLSSKSNDKSIYIQINDYQMIFGDDVIQIGSLDFHMQRFNVGHFEDMGHRRQMEDMSVISHEMRVSGKVSVSFYAVFDGHGTQDCVAFIASHLEEKLRENVISSTPPLDQQPDFYAFWHEVITRTFAEVDEMFYQELREYALNSGSTAIITLIVGNIVMSINLGDSRAILSKGGKLVELSQDHKPYNPDEKARVEKAGGSIHADRIQGQLAVSRAFGDFDYKAQMQGHNHNKKNFKENLISIIPDIRVYELDYLRDEFILLGCDGLYEQLTNQECIDFIRQRLAERPVMQQDPKEVAKQLGEEALRRAVDRKRPSDNLSIIIICLNRGIVI